jgi:hypothetical protein
MTAPVSNQAASDTPEQLTRFGSLAFKIMGGTSAAVAAVTALYATLFSPDTDLLRLLGLAAVLFGLITLGIAAGLLLMKRRAPVASGEGQVVTPAFPPEDRQAARKLLLPFAAGLVAIAFVMFAADYALTPKIYEASLLETDNEVLHLKGSGFGHDPGKIRVKFSQDSTEEFVASKVQPDGVDVAVPPKFQKGNITVRRGPRSSSSLFFTYPGVIYDVAVVEMMQPTEVDSVEAVFDKINAIPKFPYFSDTSDNTTQWPPQAEKGIAEFIDLMKAQLSGAAGSELQRWEKHAKQEVQILGDDGEMSVNQSYMRLRNLLNQNHGDVSKVAAIVGLHCAQAMETLETARHKLATHVPNRLMILSVHNGQIQDVENFSVEVKVGGAIYDATVNEEGEKTHRLEWSPERIDVDVPRLRPGYTAMVQVWYHFMGPEQRVFPDAADVEWAKTQGVVIGNMSISNGQLRRSQKLLADLEAYHRYPVDPVKSSPTFGKEISLPGAKPVTAPGTAPNGTSDEAPTRQAHVSPASFVQLGANNTTAAADHLKRGRELYAKNDLDGAIAEYRAALRLDSTLATAHYLIGVALNDKGDADGAIAQYQSALLINSKIADAHLNLARLLQDKRNDLDGAIVEPRRAEHLSG